MSRLKILIPLIVMAGCSSRKETTPPPDTSTVSAPKTSAGRIAAAYIDAWNRHDSAAIDTLLAPDGKHEDMPSATAATGPSEVRGLMRDFIMSQPDYIWRVTDIIDGDTKAAVIWTWESTFTGPDPSGKKVTNYHVRGSGTSVVDVESGKIKRMRNYYDEASLFRKPTA